MWRIQECIQQQYEQRRLGREGFVDLLGVGPRIQGGRRAVE